MRLKEVGPFLRNLLSELARASRELNVRLCEGNALVYKDVCYSLRVTVSTGGPKTVWADTVPWIVARADNAVDARTAIDQLRSLPKLDLLSQRYRDTLLPSLQLVVDGGPVASDLSDEMSKLNNTPVEEGPGEGYHRATNCSLSRSRVSRHPWLMASTRFKQNLEIGLRFCRRHGEAGKAVFRFEWRRYKRLLRGSMSRRYRPLNIKPAMFYRRLYRLDAQAAVEDWSILTGDVAGDAGEPAVERSSVEVMQAEYTQCASHPSPHS